MRLLLDTHAALWWFNADRRLSAAARTAVGNAEQRFLSVAAGWEMAIKCSTGKLRLPMPVARFLTEHMVLNQITWLAIAVDDLGRLESLPFHHRDPFDRMMAAQALERGLTIASADATFERYGIDRIW